MSGAHASAPAATYAIAHAVWQGAAIAVVAGVALRALARRSAALRHAVGMAALALMVIAPIATFAMYRVPGRARGVAEPVGPSMIHGAAWLALIVPMLWCAGAAVLAVRQLRGWRAVGVLARSGAAPGVWALQIDELRRALGIGRPIAVRMQPGVAPFTAYARRPIVWLPARWGELPPGQRDALAVHELAHVRRLDWIWNAVQRGLEAALWFHPAARWLGRRVRQEREHACDDLAVATCGDPIALVEALVGLERGAQLGLAAGGGELVERTRRLLDAPAGPSRVPRVVLGALALGAVIVTQLALPRDMLLGLRVGGSARGVMTPGTDRDITADAFLAQRHYHGAMDADGRLRESYEEDGDPRPIDPGVRAWIDEMIATDAR